MQYISRFCTLHKKSGGGLSANGWNCVRNDVGRSEEKEGAEKVVVGGSQMTS